jgi:hypothetical protein
MHGALPVTHNAHADILLFLLLLLLFLLQPAQADTAITKTDVLRLHSRPGSSRKMFLDFDGHTTTGTAWNNAANPTIVTPAYDTVRVLCCAVLACMLHFPLKAVLCWTSVLQL